jgi:probable F420-dependent oxidoreductase
VRLGTLGVWMFAHSVGEERLGEAASTAERLGYGVFWLGGSPRLPLLRRLLEASEHLVAATGIVNIWSYEPAELAAEYAELAAEFPGRLLVGIGVGHPEASADYAHPVAAMRTFLDGLDIAAAPVPRDRRCLAALAPRMLALSRERTLGTAPYFVPVAHTRAVRAALGKAPLLAPEVAVVVDEDDARARATARKYARSYLERANYASNLLRHGFDDQDLAEDGSDRLIDAVVLHGSPAAVAAGLQAHLDAGADHVAVQALGEPGIPAQTWAAVAGAMRRL